MKAVSDMGPCNRQPTQLYFTQLPTRYLYRGKWRSHDEMLAIADAEAKEAEHDRTEPRQP